MSKHDAGLHHAWLEAMQRRAKVELTVAKQLSGLSNDPFKARDMVAKSKEALERERCEVPEDLNALLADLESKCVISEAEFWDGFERECAHRDWSLEGTTLRRILCRGLPVELRDGSVLIEELGVSLTPVASEVAQQLEAVVAALVPKDFDPRAFMDLLAASYDQTAGAAEKPIESVYRSTVLLSQKSAFWKSLVPSRFTRLTRPEFRARMAAAIEANVTSSDGRAPRFGTTVNTSQAWEIYSPGERRSVQVGRLTFIRGGEPDGN